MNIANFSKGENYKEIYGGLWQWDYGQVLRIQGLDLPTAIEIHFSLQEKGGEAVTRVGTTKDGATDVVIPDSMLENNRSLADYFIYAFIYLTDETSGQTEYKISMKVKARPKPEAYDTPEDAELFREAITAVNEAADRAETAEKEAEGWVHGREDMPEKAEDNAKYYAGKAAKDAEQTSADRKKVERLVESVSGIDEDVELVRGFKEAAEKAAGDASGSAEKSEEFRKAAEAAKAESETAQTKAEEAAGKTAEDREAVEQAKTDVEGMKNQVTEDKTSIEQTVADFTLTAQQAVTDVKNAGQEQTERVQGTGNTGVQEIQTAKEQAVQSVETVGTQQAQAVQTEGTTQIGAVQQKGQEILDSIPEDFTTQMAGKLEKNQGAENSGKVMVVGEDGTVAPGEIPVKVDSTLTKSGQAADAKTTGDTITALAIKNQASGEVPIIITDSAEYPIQDMGMNGWTEQQSTTGAQLFDIDDNVFEKDILSFTCHLIEGETYTISISGNVKIRIKISNAGSGHNSVNFIIDGSQSFQMKRNENIPESLEQHIYFFLIVDNADVSVTDISMIKDLNIMLNSGSTALPYEPYTGGQPSPSPDYPQEIVSAGKYNEETQKWKYEVKVQGKNYLDIGTITFEQAKIFTANIPAGTYTFSAEVVSNDTDSTACLIMLQKNGLQLITFSVTRNSRKSSTFTIKEDADTIILYASTGYNQGYADTATFGDVQLEIGSVATPFEPYKEPKTVILQSDRPLTKWDRLEKRDGQWGWVYKSKETILNGDVKFNKYLESQDDTNTFYSTRATHDTCAGGKKLFADKLKAVETAYASPIPYLISGHPTLDEYIYITVPSDIETPEDFSMFLESNPVKVWYESIEENFVPLTASEQEQMNSLHTNRPTTVLMNDQGCEMSLEYVADTKNYIDQKIQESIQQSIAGNLLSTNGSQSLSAPMGAALNLRIEALEAKTE